MNERMHPQPFEQLTRRIIGRRFAASEDRCAGCGYEMPPPAPIRCPECGRVAAPPPVPRTLIEQTRTIMIASAVVAVNALITIGAMVVSFFAGGYKDALGGLLLGAALFVGVLTGALLTAFVSIWRHGVGRASLERGRPAESYWIALVLIGLMGMGLLLLNAWILVSWR